MINWNEVTVGETEIISPANETWLIVGRNNGKVWLYSDGVHYTRKEDSLGDWTIYDPLEDITDQITLEPTRVSVCGHGDAEYVVFVGCYKGKRLLWTDPNISFDGRRVWKRKEG